MVHLAQLSVASSLALVLLGGAASPARAGHGPDPWLARDKALHLGVSAVLAGGGYAAGALVSERVSVRLAVGGGLALTAGVAKELRDRYAGGDPSWRDLGADVVGTATGLAVAWLIDRYLW